MVTIVGVNRVNETMPHGTESPDNRARVQELKAAGLNVQEIMEATGLKKPTVYAYLRPEKQKSKPKAVTAPKGDNSLTVTPTANGAFMVRVPADKLAAVAKALA